MGIGQVSASIVGEFVVSVEGNSQETIVIESDHGVSTGDEHVNSEIELVIEVQEQGVGNVGLGNERLVQRAAQSTVLVFFFNGNSLFFIQKEDTSSLMSTETDLDNILNGVSLLLLEIRLGVDFLEESLAFAFNVQSVREGEELLLVEALALFFVQFSISTKLKIRGGSIIQISYSTLSTIRSLRLRTP